MKKILFITNGHGEDLVAARIIKELMDDKVAIHVLPVVGNGDVFKSLRVKILGPRNILPGGGFGLRNYGYLFRDFSSGLIANTLKQVDIIKKNKYEYSLVIGIGDIVPMIYSMFTGSRFILIGVNKSEYYKKLAFNYTGLEKWLLKRSRCLTLARDEITARSLAAYGITAMYVGNPMMDLVKSGIRYKGQGIKKNQTIGFLPGTREDAYNNIEDFYKIMEQIRKIDRKFRFILSFPPTLCKAKLKEIRKPDNLKIEFSKDFNNVLKRSAIIIGLSGTANEQAAGLGIPVIAFPGRGAQFNSRFAHGQKELLGDSLLLLPKDPSRIADEAIALIHDKKRMNIMGAAGRKRMGIPGASKKIADIIKKEIRI